MIHSDGPQIDVVAVMNGARPNDPGYLTTTDRYVDIDRQIDLDLDGVDLPSFSPPKDPTPLSLPGHVVNTDVDTRTVEDRVNRQHANKYVIATQLSKKTQDNATPEQWDELCKRERDGLIRRLICPLCRGGPYKHKRSLRRHYQVEKNTCDTLKKAEDPNRERTKQNRQAAKRLADPFEYNTRAAKRQTYDYKKEMPTTYDDYAHYAYDVERGMFCGGTCKD